MAKTSTPSGPDRNPEGLAEMHLRRLEHGELPQRVEALKALGAVFSSFPESATTNRIERLWNYYAEPEEPLELKELVVKTCAQFGNKLDFIKDGLAPLLREPIEPSQRPLQYAVLNGLNSAKDLIVGTLLHLIVKLWNSSDQEVSYSAFWIGCNILKAGEDETLKLAIKTTTLDIKATISQLLSWPKNIDQARALRCLEQLGFGDWGASALFEETDPSWLQFFSLEISSNLTAMEREGRKLSLSDLLGIGELIRSVSLPVYSYIQKCFDDGAKVVCLNCSLSQLGYKLAPVITKLSQQISSSCVALPLTETEARNLLELREEAGSKRLSHLTIFCLLDNNTELLRNQSALAHVVADAKNISYYGYPGDWRTIMEIGHEHRAEVLAESILNILRKNFNAKIIALTFEIEDGCKDGNSGVSMVSTLRQDDIFGRNIKTLFVTDRYGFELDLDDGLNNLCELFEQCPDIIESFGIDVLETPIGKVLWTNDAPRSLAGSFDGLIVLMDSDNDLGIPTTDPQVDTSSPAPVRGPRRLVPA